MRQLQKGTHQSDTTRIAILAALNLADRLLSFIEKDKAREGEVAKVSQELSQILDQAITNQKG